MAQQVSIQANVKGVPVAETAFPNKLARQLVILRSIDFSNLTANESRRLHAMHGIRVALYRSVPFSSIHQSILLSY